jgi:hypothetical protein
MTSSEYYSLDNINLIHPMYYSGTWDCISGKSHKEGKPRNCFSVTLTDQSLNKVQITPELPYYSGGSIIFDEEPLFPVIIDLVCNGCIVERWVQAHSGKMNCGAIIPDYTKNQYFELSGKTIPNFKIILHG